MGRILIICLLLTALPWAVSEPLVPSCLDPHQSQPGKVFLASPEGRARAVELCDCKGAQHLLLALEGDASAPPNAELLDLKGQRARTDRDLAQRVHQACCLELHGGHMSGWWRALFPREKRTALGGALHQAWRRGTPMLGTGAAAALLGSGGPAVDGQWPLSIRNRKKDHDWGRALTGLGISPLPLLGASGLPTSTSPAVTSPAVTSPAVTSPAVTSPTEGTATQVLDAMERFGVEAGAWFEGSVALVWSPQERTLQVHGPGRLHFLVLDGAHRSAHILGLLWELGDGSIWIPSREEIRTPTGDRPLSGVQEKRSLGSHRLTIRSLPASRHHQRKGHLPTRTVLQAELIRKAGRGHDQIR